MKPMIQKLLIKIPKGKITTYKELARIAKTSPRAVGSILRNNKNPEKYPCYKVVRSDGSIGGYFGKTSGKYFENKIFLLRKDGIEINDGKIKISRYIHRFKARNETGKLKKRKII